MMNFPDRNHLLQLRKELWHWPHFPCFGDGWRRIQPQCTTLSWGGHAIPELASVGSRYV